MGSWFVFDDQFIFRQLHPNFLGAPKRWDDRLVLAAVELPPHRFGALTKFLKSHL